MHRLHIPAVTRPVDCPCVSLDLLPRANEMCNTPQTTLVLPPEVKLMDKLADNAVHDCDISLGGPSRMPILTFNTAKANPNIDLGLSALQLLSRGDLSFSLSVLFLVYCILTGWKSSAGAPAGGPWQSIECRRPSY